MPPAGRASGEVSQAGRISDDGLSVKVLAGGPIAAGRSQPQPKASSNLRSEPAAGVPKENQDPRPAPTLASNSARADAPQSNSPDGRSSDPDRGQDRVGAGVEFDIGKTTTTTQQFRDPTSITSQTPQLRDPTSITTQTTQFRDPSSTLMQTPQFRDPSTTTTQTTLNKGLKIDLGLDLKVVKGVRMPLALDAKRLEAEAPASRSDLKDRIVRGPDGR
jgi:hypothetical protein